MKRLVRYFNVVIIVILFLHTACEDGAGTLTGSTDVTVLSNVSFTNTQVSVNSDGLVASGIATNNSSVATGSPWYIECNFYNTDVSGNKFLISGGNQQINQPLNSSVSFNWEISLSDDNPGNYNALTVEDLRAYKN
tara:strand:- start:16 stop:423 length:408 start_codon:yes stop_codon:yes gene_type:complete